MINVEINFSDVFTEVKRLTEYIGQKAGNYDQLRAIDEDKDQMMSWYLNGCAIVNGILDRLITRNIHPDYNTGNFSLVIMTENNSEDLITKVIIRLLATHMVNQWLKLVAPDRLQLFANDETLVSQELMQMAYYRTMPR